MITTCPKCQTLLSVPMPGRHACKKCGSIIEIGNPLRDEENRVIEAHVAPPPPKPPAEDEEGDEWESDEVEPAEGATARDEKPDPIRQAQTSDRAATVKGTLGVAWDRVGELGFIEAIFGTTRDLVTAPEKFFTEMKAVPAGKFIPFYGILIGIAGAAFNLFWMLWIVHNHRPLVEAYIPPMLLESFMKMGTADIMAQILLSPIVNIVVASFMLFGFSVLFGADTKLQHFYRLAGFTAAFDIFYAIPVVGWLIAFIWRSVLIVKGIRVVTDLPGRRAALVFLLYLVLSIVLLLPVGGGA
ncbi:MAG TPA: YIP1 family protein [bacterium]|nr:YIP1 family protein [bacterium]